MRFDEPRLTPKAQQELEDSFRNDAEAHELLALINAEFQSDPTSVQCFDLRVVERVRICVAKQHAAAKSGVRF